MIHDIRSKSRRGTILPLLAITCFSLFGFVALAIDLGMLMVARSECQNAADTAALTGARMLDNNLPAGGTEATYDNNRPAAIIAAIGGPNIGGVRDNYLLNTTFAFNDTSIDKVEIGIYDYNITSQVFQSTFPAVGADPTQKLTGSNGTVRPWTACRVTVKGDQPTYFARIFGITSMPMLARATSAHRPRDIAMVLDYSGSMQFASTGEYPSGDGSSTGAIIGLMNPDPRIPQFGHYQRYDGRQTTNPNGTNQHPLQSTSYYTMGSGEILSPNNMTYDGPGGPSMVLDFLTTSDTNPNNPVNPSLLQPGFTSPNSVCPLDDGSHSYNSQALAFSTTAVGPVGDRWPRKGGVRYASAQSWDPTTTTGAAGNTAELLFASGNFPATPTSRGIPSPRLAITSSGNLTEGSTAWSSFYDDGFERNGYDLDIPTYISSSYKTASKRTTEKFQGYTLGPGYWGKTFFCWPPDPRYGPQAGVARTTGASGNMPDVTSPDTTGTYGPAFDSSGRAMCDWRQRFFLNGSGVAWNPQTDNINGTLLNTTSGGQTLSTTNTNFRVNYPAVLAWIKSGAQVLPPNLRAGRILYYTQIPSDCTTPTTLDQTFWREYIDYVLGVTRNRLAYNPAYGMAGTEPTAWGTFGITATTAFTPNGATNANPKPYMCYKDTPNMPRMHFWFGPASMLMFLNPRGTYTNSHDYNFNAGTVHEAQDWQLKSAMQSCLDDIRKNHPNDQAGLAFFAYSNFRSPMHDMSQDWDYLKAALFFPKSILSDVVAGNAHELRPYDSNFNATLVGSLPNANGGTDPNNGLAIAYNMLGNSSTSISNGTGSGGRRGAAKIVIFETDGVPNSYQTWTYTAAGADSRYDWIDGGQGLGNGNSTCMQDAYDIVTQIAASTTAASPGYSLPNIPARVYPFAFGDMFTPQCTSTFKPTALTFLQTIAYNGNTNTSTSTALPTTQVITGDYTTRITNLRTGLETVLQNGVQVALIE